MDEDTVSMGGSTTEDMTLAAAGREANLKAADSFLDSLGDEVRPMEGVTNSPTRLGEGAEKTVVEQHTSLSPSQSRRESQIWDGAFVDETSRRAKRSRPASMADNEVGPAKVRHVDMESGYAPVELPRSSPGLWVVETGLRTTGIAMSSFDVDTEMALAAKRWCEGPDYDSERTDYLKVNLGCCPEIIDEDIPTAQEKAYTTESAWSSTCLCVQMNGHVWSPSELTSQEGQIDMTQFIRSGRNELELVQISSTSGVVFFVSAVHPSEREFQYAKRKKRLHSLIRSHHRAADSLPVETVVA